MSLQYIKYGAYYIIALAYNRIRPAGRYMPFRITLTQLRAYFLLRKWKIFDHQWYIQRYPDVSDSNIDPICHFVRTDFTKGAFQTSLSRNTKETVLLMRRIFRIQITQKLLAY